jgi:hypothetical protein
MLFGFGFLGPRRVRPGSRELETCRRDRRRAFTVSRWTWLRPPGHNGQVGAAAKQRSFSMRHMCRPLYSAAARANGKPPDLRSGFLGPRTDSLICHPSATGEFPQSLRYERRAGRALKSLAATGTASFGKLHQQRRAGSRCPLNTFERIEGFTERSRNN